jgi:succinate dehydrogenase hydrophobic anchor subunit
VTGNQKAGSIALISFGWNAVISQISLSVILSHQLLGIHAKPQDVSHRKEKHKQLNHLKVIIKSAVPLKD